MNWHKLIKHTFYLILISCCMPFLTFGQSFKVRGIIFKKNASERVAEVQVINKATKESAFSDQYGIFNITASKGDTLSFYKNGYTPQTFAVYNNSDFGIYLQPVVELSDVLIKEKTKQQEMKEIMDSYRSKGVYDNGKPSALSMLAHPLNGLYSLFGKDPGRARRFNNYIKSESEYLEVNRRYTKSLVKETTKLPDDEVDKFMTSYRPMYQDLKNWSDYDLIKFIMKSLEDYKLTGGKSIFQKLQ